MANLVSPFMIKVNYRLNPMFDLEMITKSSINFNADYSFIAIPEEDLLSPPEDIHNADLFNNEKKHV